MERSFRSAVSSRWLIFAEGRWGTRAGGGVHKDAVCNTWQKDLKLDYKLLFRQVNVHGVFIAYLYSSLFAGLCLPSVNVNTLF